LRKDERGSSENWEVIHRGWRDGEKGKGEGEGAQERQIRLAQVFNIVISHENNFAGQKLASYLEEVSR